MLKQRNVVKRSALICLVTVWSTLILSCSLSSKSSAPDPEAQKRYANQKALEAKTAEFTVMPTKVQLVKEPYLKGKIAFYRQLSGTWYLENFDDQYKDKPKVQALFAQAPDEVGTIVLIPDCAQTKKGEYEVSAGYNLPAYIEKCEVSLIDPATSTVIYRKDFTGRLDKETKVDKTQSEVVGFVDKAEIYDFLTSLTRK